MLVINKKNTDITKVSSWIEAAYLCSALVGTYISSIKA